VEGEHDSTGFPPSPRGGPAEYGCDLTHGPHSD
jgi:hypothetical protein